MTKDPTVRLYQIYYKDEQLGLLDRQAIPYDNRGVDNPFLEYAVISNLKRKQESSACKYWGALSWRFTEKTGLNFSVLDQHIKNNPGIDVYYINPSLSADAMYPNIWQQGEARHPGLLELMNAIFKSDPEIMRLFSTLIPSRWNAACHYIIATNEFWESYTSFVDRLVLPVLQDNDLRCKVLSNAADNRRLHNGSTYLPFLIERLFTLYMLNQGVQKFKSAKIEVRYQDGVKSLHLNKLKDVRDKAFEGKSRAGVNLWIAYRYWVAKNILALPDDQISKEFSLDHKNYEFLELQETSPISPEFGIG